MIELIKSRFNGKVKENLMIAYKKHKKYKSKLSKVYLRYYISQYIFGSKSAKTRDKYRTKSISNFERKGYYDFDVFKMPCFENEYKDALVEEFSDFIAPMFYDNPPFSYEGSYEQYGVEICKDDIVIDAGANIGLFSAFAIAKGAEKVYAFEPVEYVAEKLNQTKIVNNYNENLEIIMMGLSDKSGKADIHVGDDIVISTLLMDDRTNRSIDIKIITLDKFVEENKIRKIDFIKADIEGAERNLLYGAREVLKEFKPKLSICTYHLPDDKEVLTSIILKANPTYRIKYSKKKLFAI